MLNFKKEIAKKIENITEINYNEIENILEIPKEKDMGDYALPCFRFAKVMKKAPQAIANDINDKLNINNDNIIKKTEVVGRILKLLCK